MIVLGIDAGGTKTKAWIANEQGVLGVGNGGAANYQLCGTEMTQMSLTQAMTEALQQSGLSLAQIDYGVFGMSGADEALDYQILEPMVAQIMGRVPHHIVNDTWIGLRAGSEENWGVVSICGTGAGHAGRNRQGDACLLMNMDYTLGNRGGGGELANDALHYAFRSMEQTYLPTVLEQKVPRVFGVTSLQEVYQIIRHQGIGREAAFLLPKCVTEGAEEGDGVCQKLLSDMGHQEGLYALSVMKQLKMLDEAVPVVMIGSLFRIRNRFIESAYKATVLTEAPKARCHVLDQEPVLGAIGLAFDALSKF